MEVAHVAPRALAVSDPGVAREASGNLDVCNLMSMRLTCGMWSMISRFQGLSWICERLELTEKSAGRPQ